MIVRVIVILTLVAALLGGSGYFLYESYFKPKKLDREEKKAVAAAPPVVPPDPSLPSYKKVKPLVEQDSTQAREALLAFLKEFPDSPKAPEVRTAIGRINVALVLSPVPLPEKESYTVQKGDSLSKIATKLKSGAELIYRANNLQTINLKIGQELVVPKLDTAIVVDRAKKTLTVSNAGQFFKEYPVRSIKISGAHGPGAIETKVLAKEAVKGTARISFGSKDYEGSERRVILATSGITIRATEPPKEAEPATEAEPAKPAEPEKPPKTAEHAKSAKTSKAAKAAKAAEPAKPAEPAPAAEPPKAPEPAPVPTGILLDPNDAEEVYFLTTRGTPVTIK